MFPCAKAALKRHISRQFATDATFRGPPKPGDSVVVGMSGGVDSSVAACLLAQQDFNLSAVYMRNWDSRDETGSDNGCEWEKDWEDVQRVCKALDIPCQMIDLSRQYWNQVFEPALRIWETGDTPNPDVWCNREIKFGTLLHHLPDNNAWFATGHYARKGWTNETPSRPLLLRSSDTVKDQTYYLSSIPSSGLARALFPLGPYTKDEVRALARNHRLPTAERQESMGLCFVGEKAKFHDFLSSYLPPKPGPIVDLESGKQLGTHQGLWNFTLGQKARILGMPQKMYVSGKDMTTNTIFVVPGGDHPELLRNSFRPVEWKWILGDVPQELCQHRRLRGTSKIRHRMPPVPCTVSFDENENLNINFDVPQKGVAPGQVVTVWDERGAVLGCGILASASYAV